MTRIFISYSREDEEFARKLATSLSEAGATVWLDVEDIPAGMNWTNAIQEGLDSCDAILVIITPSSSLSENVKDEWQYFREQHKPIIPIELKPAKSLHFQIKNLQRIDFFEQKYDIAFQKLLKALYRNGISTGYPPTEKKDSKKKRKQVKESEPKPPIDKILSDDYQIEEKLFLTQQDVKRQAAQILAIGSALTSLREITVRREKNPHVKPKADKSDIADLLLPLVVQPNYALGFEENDPLNPVWNVALYIHNPETDLLEVYWRDSDSRIQRLNRSWQNGQGHVGIAFARNEVIITPDATDKNSQKLLGAGNPEHRERDNNLYRSYISIPIGNTNDDHKRFGVLMITSSKQGQFDDTFQAFCELYRLILTIYFYSHTIKYD